MARYNTFMSRKTTLQKQQRAIRRKRAARHAVAHAVMGALAISAGAVLLTAPGLADIVRLLPGRRKSTSAVARVITDLYRKGIVTLSGTRGARMALLTDAGRRLIFLNNLSLRVPNKKNWNELWFMVSFDIPATAKRARDSLRRKLKEIGFVEYQKSLYLFPVGGESEVDFIVDYYGVKPWVRYFYVADLQDDTKYRALFGLR